MEEKMYYSTTYSSPVGKYTLVSDGEHLVGAWLDGQKYHRKTISGVLTEENEIPVLGATVAWLDSYFAGEKPAIADLPLAPIGGEFRQGVWDILCKIPYGELLTYGYIAQKMAAKMKKEKMSSQAVGGAVGNNPISIIIPCHRVVGAKGNLTGYAAGIDVKIKLLELEGVAMSGLYVPKKGTAL
jgi:methylated-DNA-[protein]-cysteine S-methyltransferase